MILILLGAVLMLGVSIFIHELGHLLCGMLVGVKARIFSIGYGRGVWKKRVGETTYQITGIPIGGYVMFKGDQYGRKLKGKKGELLSTPPLKRIIPVLGGPLFNLLLGFLLFFILALLGDTPPISRIYIDPTYDFMPAYKSGLRTGDEILAINGKPTPYFEDIFNTISLSAGEPMEIEFKRNGVMDKVTISPDIYSGGGRPTIGVEPFGKRNVVVTFTYGEQFRHFIKSLLGDETGTTSNQSFSPVRAIAFLNDGDEILEVEGKSVSTVTELQAILGAYQNRNVKLKVLRKKYPLLTPWSKEEVSLEMPVLGADVLEFYDLVDKKINNFYIKNISIAGYDPKIIQKIANLKIDGQSFESFDALKKGILSGKKVSLDIQGLEYEGIAKIKPIGLLGFRPSMKFEPEKKSESISIPSAFYISIERIYDNISSSLKGLKMVFSGILSVRENLSGPIGIVQIAGITLEYGIFTYLDFAARISIALMIMNLLPIPVADGGHVVLYLYEAIAGRPLPNTVIEIIFRIGLVFLLSVGLFVTFFDFIRLFR